MPCATCAAEVDARAVVCVHCGADLIAFARPESELTSSAAAPLETDRRLQGLGGWLILVCIALVITPFRLIGTMARTNLPALMDVKYQPFLEKHPAYHALLLFEFATNICYLALTLALIYLFLKRRQSFPTYWILCAAFHLVVHFGDISATHIMLHSSKFSPQSIGDMIGTLLSAAIWVPYFLVSKRVKVTFIR